MLPPARAGDAVRAKEVIMDVVKALIFPVQARWFGGRLLRLGAPVKPALRVATPPEFKDGIPGIWSPEDLLVGSLAACYELTLVAIAERHDVPLHTLEVNATGHLERAPKGEYGFTVVELDVDLATDPGRELDAEEVAVLAKQHCIVGRALDVPVHLRRLEVRAASFVAVDAA
jgi:organic hydroperoxide reductase OsmC/OhrA